MQTGGIALNRKEALDAAAQCVLQDRNSTYGGPEESFGLTSDLWTSILRPILKDGASVSASQVAMCMIGLKLARLAHNPTHADSVVDVIGYGSCLAELATAARSRAEDER
jgi:hypothetical protein